MEADPRRGGCGVSLAHCRALVEAGDPDRALVTRGAGADRLWPVWALNLEVARAPWATREPMVAEIRLQFWADSLAALAAGERVAGHPVLEALAASLPGEAMPGEAMPGLAPELAAVLAEVVEARRQDCWRAPFADPAALWAYLEGTGGALSWAAARVLGAPPEAEAVARDMGSGAALAAWLRALPVLEAQGWAALPAGTDVAALARAGLDRIARARAGRAHVPGAAFAALAAGWQAPGILRRAARAPARVAEGRLQPSEFARRGGLFWAGLTGRW